MKLNKPEKSLIMKLDKRQIFIKKKKRTNGAKPKEKYIGVKYFFLKIHIFPMQSHGGYSRP